MSIVTVSALFPANINSSGSDSVSFSGLGTLNIAGTPQNPITVTLSQVGGIGLLDTINISYADVTLEGVAGISALVAYNIGSGGTLRLQSSIGVSLGTTIDFSAPSSHLVIGSGVNVNLLGAIAGFAEGSDIDLSSAGFASYSYTDNAGSGTGGTLTLRDAGGNTTGTVKLSTGEFTASSFHVHPDGASGTLIDFLPYVSSISATPSTGDLTTGANVVLRLTTSAPVIVAGGTPTLSLNDGGVATYDAANSTSTSLAFNYTVQPGQNTGDLTITGTNLNGATVKDSAGYTADLTGATGNPAGILQIDTTPPTITAISTTPGGGSFGAGQLVSISLTPSEAVTVAGGTPTLTLNDGGIATYDSANSTATHLVFDYTVQSGQNVADLAVTGSSLNGATITDAAGNAANLAGAAVNPAGILAIDTTPPTIVSVSTTPGSGSVAAGQVVAFNVSASEAVTVTGGTPTLTLNDGRSATYDPGSSTPTNLVFKYVVQPGDMAADLAVTGANSNGALIADAAGNVASLAGAIGNPAGILQVDTTMPAVTSVYDVTTTPGSGDLSAGSPVALQIQLTGTVTVSGGTPTLTLNDGGIAIYDATHSTATNLIFNYTVQPGQNVADLAVTGSNLNGATITDAAGNAADLTGAAVNPTGVLTIDTTPPTIIGLSTTPGSGSLAAGQVVAISLTPSETVTVAGGTPTLTLNDGGIATYDAADSTATNLVFKYVVQPGDMAADLAVTGTNLNGATITDAAGKPANLAGAIENPPGVLQIDTTRPPVTSVFNVTTTPGSGDLAAGNSVAIRINLTGSATVTGGAPTLTLSDGGSATYDATNSTSTSLAFVHTVLAGQNSPDLTVTTVALNGATVADGSGNAVDLSGAVTNPGGILQIDTTSPTITAVTTAPGSGSFAAGQIVAITLTPSEAVTVTGGTPTLTLNDGGTAIYDAVNSTATKLVFDYTVQAGQNSPDLAVTRSTLNGATIADQAGNVLDLSGSIGNPAGILQIDTTAPTVIAVTTQPGGGTVTAGQVVTIRVTPSEVLTVNGGTPTLMLNDGGTAVYDATASTPTALVFNYTVANQQDTSDLAVTGSNLNGASVTDAAGNELDLSGVVGNPPGVLAVDTLPVVNGISLSPHTIDVYRFFDTKTGTHFYTQDKNEDAAVLATRPDLVPEGPNGVGLSAVNSASNDPNAVPVYRFFDLTNGTHFFTASTTERDTVISTRQDLAYEPSSTFYEHVTQQAGDTAVYRFFDTRFGTHFYTDDSKERASILQTRPDLVQEGIGFYEPARNPTT